VHTLAGQRDLVLVEGAGGLLVRFDDTGWTVADLALRLGAPVLLVVDPGLGTLKPPALSLEALATRGIACAGVVLGSWPAPRTGRTWPPAAPGGPRAARRDRTGRRPAGRGRRPRPDRVRRGGAGGAVPRGWAARSMRQTSDEPRA